MKFEDKTVKSTQPSLALIGLHDFLIFSNRMAHAWSVEAGNICWVSVFFVRVSSQISPRRTKKDSNIPSPGRTRWVKSPTPRTTKTIKSPPYALPPYPTPPPPMIGALNPDNHGFQQSIWWFVNLWTLIPSFLDKELLPTDSVKDLGVLFDPIGSFHCDVIKL